MKEAVIVDGPSLSRLLRMAVVGGVESSVRVHVERGDDLDARDGSGMTPLMLAAARNRAGICRLLLDSGADGSLLSPSGVTALEIALAAGAQEAAGILAMATASTLVAPPFTVSTVAASKSIGKIDFGAAIDLVTSYAQSKPEPIDESVFQLNLDDWEPEENNPPPKSDQSLVAAVSAVSKAITQYETFDSSSDWDDVDIDLPDQSAPLLRVAAATSNQKLRRLLLHAMRHGSISPVEMESLCVNLDGSWNPSMESALSMAVNGVGAEVVDQAIGFGAINQLDELSEVASTFDEDAVLDEALFFIEANASGLTDPLRFYQKELQRQKLLTSQQEISLVRQIEKTGQTAIAALAAWPRGITLVLAAGRAVETGQRLSNSYTRGALENEADVSVILDGIGEVERPEAEQEDEETDQQSGSMKRDSDESHHPSAQLSRSLTQLEVHLVAGGAVESLVHETLSALRLNHEFLFELADAANADQSEGAMRYNAAMRDFRGSWQQMFLANVKLAFSLAHKYRYSGEPLADLAQEGNLGLLKAIERFDWRRGHKFSTYATWWIKQSIGRHVADKSRTIRIPVYVHADLQRMLRVTQALESEGDDRPNLHAIAARMDMRPDKVAALQRLEHEGTTLDEASFAELMDSDSASDLFLPDPEDLTTQSQLKHEIDRILSTLQPKEEQVIRRRFGIGVDDELTLEEVGKQFGVTRERIRQIEAKALKKLRHPSRIHALSLAARGVRAKVEDLPAPESGQAECKAALNYVSNEEPAHTAALASPSTGETDSEELLPVHAAVLPTMRPETLPLQQELQLEENSTRPSYSSGKRNHLDVSRLVALAKTLDVAVDDDRDGLSGHIWFRISDTADKRYRSLVRSLITIGFEFWPGKGYWK